MKTIDAIEKKIMTIATAKTIMAALKVTGKKFLLPMAALTSYIQVIYFL